MPKVTLPLGSAKAFGQMGKMIVFQGTSVRAYTVPSDPATDAQMEARYFFRDFNSTLKTIGEFGRGLLRGYYGARWYTMALEFVAFQERKFWNFAVADWNGITPAQKAEWVSVAPFKGTVSDCGFMFYCVGQLLDSWVDRKTGSGFLDVYPYGPTAVSYRAAWDEGLDRVLTLNKTTGADSRLVYRGTWGWENDAKAFGGKFRKTSAVNSECEFYFIGKRLNIGYVGLLNGGTLQAVVDDDIVVQINQYRRVRTYGLKETLVSPNKGVHRCNLGFFGSSTQVCNFDYLDTGGT